MLVRNDKNTVFLIQNNRLRQLYETLTAGDVPLELKQMTLRDFEDYMRGLGRQAKMNFITELLWLTCGEDLDALKSALEKRGVRSEDKLSVEDKDSLVRAVVFALGGIGVFFACCGCVCLGGMQGGSFVSGVFMGRFAGVGASAVLGYVDKERWREICRNMMCSY